MEYIGIKQAAENWQVSPRLVQRLCNEGRVEGATKFSGSWAIPSDARKPEDPRRIISMEKKIQRGTITLQDLARQGHVPEEAIPMPLLNTPFLPGYCMEQVVRIEDANQRNIALCEYYYFSGQAEKAAAVAKLHLDDENLSRRLSACWVYGYANLALNRIDEVHAVFARIKQLRTSLTDELPPRDKALIVSVATGAMILLHLPLPKELPPMRQVIHLLPPGLKLFSLYVQAHDAYLNRRYGESIGIAETALALEEKIYPIPSVYLHLVATMSYMSLRQPQQAKEHLLAAWEIARPDDLIEAFGEHHGLLGGMLEAVIKKEWPEDFRRMIAITYPFSAGWRKVHNPVTGHDVAEDLTTTEFAVAMLAARDWSNKEISAHMGISANTVKHHISVALQKLGVTTRDELAKFMLK